MHRPFRLARAMLCVLGLLCLPQPGAAANAGGRLDLIAARQLLKVCIWPDYYRVSFRDPQSGLVTGIDADLARALAHELGVAVKFIDSDFSTLAADVLGNRCDIAMYAIGITPERAARLHFTAPHLASDIHAVTTRANPRIATWDDIDQPGVVVAVARGTVHERVMRSKLRHAELAVLHTPHARERAVESGRADVFMTDYPYVRHLLEHAPWARPIAPTGAYHVTPYAWAMAPGDPRWHARIDRFVAAIKADGRLLEAARQHGLEAIVVNR